MISFVTDSVQETVKMGEWLGKVLFRNNGINIVLLEGDLGAGKTQLVRGIAKGYADVNFSSVSSPTYSYLNTYFGRCPVYHFDLYRLKRGEEFFFMDFDQSFDEKTALHLIEWPQCIVPLLTHKTCSIRILIEQENRRKIDVFT